MNHEEFLQRETTARLERLEQLARKILAKLEPRLSSIGIMFTFSTAVGDNPMSAVAGPVILTTAGQVATASVLGFDQLGNPWTGTIPPVTFSSSDTAGAVFTSVDNGDGTATVTAVANGVGTLTASLTSAEGLALTDGETVTVTIGGGTGGTPVLSSIKVAFDTGTAATASTRNAGAADSAAAGYVVKKN
jgi:HAMP domain-containing protein